MTKYYISDRWSDTTGHYARDSSGTNYGHKATPAIQLNSPASGHKRAYEDATTGTPYTMGFLVAHQVKFPDTLPVKITIEGYFGAYHGYDKTRANFTWYILPSEYLDSESVPNASLRISYIMNAMGWNNGDYNKYAKTVLKINEDGSVTIESATPASPNIWNNNAGGLKGRTISILFGYHDGWVADWNQWASARQDSYIEIAPPAVAYTQEVSDVGIVGDRLEKVVKLHLSFYDIGKALDFTKKSTAKILAELVVAKDYKGFAKDLIELVVPCDKVVSSRSLHITLFDYAVPEYILGVFRAREVRDSVKAIDVVSKVAIFTRSLTDSGRATDYMRKSMTIVKYDTSISLDLINLLVIKNFIDTYRGIDKVSKDIRIRKHDSSLATDRVSKLSAKVYADVAKVSDASFRELIKSLLDYVVPEYVLSSLRGKELRDLATVVDRLGLGIPYRIYDVAKVADKKSHDVVRNFTDASLVTDYVLRELIKSIIDRVAPEFYTSKTPLHTVTDEVMSLDKIGLGIPYRVYDVAKVTDRKVVNVLRVMRDLGRATDILQRVLAKIIALTDYVVPEYVASKELGKKVIDVGNVNDVMIQWLTSIYGYVLEMPYLGAIIMPEHFNNPYNILLKFLGDVKVCWSKLGSEPYPESIADLEDTLASLKPVKTGEYVRIEHVDVTMVACYYLYKAVKDCYDKYKEVYGQEIPLVEEYLNKTYEIVYSPTIVKVGDIILPDHFLQIYWVLIYIRIALLELMSKITT